MNVRASERASEWKEEKRKSDRMWSWGTIGRVKRNKTNKHYLKFNTKTFPIIYCVFTTTTITVITIIAASPVTHVAPANEKKNQIIYYSTTFHIFHCVWFRVINFKNSMCIACTHIHFSCDNLVSTDILFRFCFCFFFASHIDSTLWFARLSISEVVVVIMAKAAAVVTASTNTCTHQRWIK